MARSQNTPRGFFAKNRIDMGGNSITKNSTAILFSQGIRLSGAQYLSGNSTGVIFGTQGSALPGSVRIATTPVIAAINNSTGRCLAINTTGTTWLYLAATSVQPTT